MPTAATADAASRCVIKGISSGRASNEQTASSGPAARVHFRCFAVYYNQTRIGRLEIHPGFKYTTETPQVYTSVQIDWSRLLGYRTITEFLDAIASHVTNPNPKSDEYVSARQGIQAALTERLWANYGMSEFDRVFANEEDMDWGELKVRFDGAAEWYFTRRNAAEDRRNKQSRCSECAGKVDRPRPDR